MDIKIDFYMGIFFSEKEIINHKNKAYALTCIPNLVQCR